MAKKTAKTSGRSDPKQNKSLAVREVLKKMPEGKAADVVAAVKKEFGHDVSQSMIYMVKTKSNMAADGRGKKKSGGDATVKMTSAALWVEAIKLGRQLIKSTGSLDNAMALLKAVDG